jgi:dihydroorotate dehydrogenase
LTLKNGTANLAVVRNTNREATMLNTQIGNKTMLYPLMNGAGSCGATPEKVRWLAMNAEIGAVVVGPMTVKPRPINKGNVFDTNDPLNTMNSLGLPNDGEEEIVENLPEMVRICHGEGKLLIVSQPGFCRKDFVTLAAKAAEAGVDGVESNAGCPNVWDDGSQHDILSFELDELRATMLEVRATVGPDFIVGLKVSPYSNPMQLVRTARMVRDDLDLDYVAAINTFPNAFKLTPEGKPVLDTMLFGGLAGAEIKAMALGQVYQWHRTFIEDPKKPTRTKLIGVGGISSGQDMLDFMRVGASACQVVSHFLRRSVHEGFEGDPGVFVQILNAYTELLAA